MSSAAMENVTHICFVTCVKNGLTVHLRVNHGPSDHLEGVHLLGAALQIVLDDDEHGGDEDLVAGAGLLQGVDERAPDRRLALVPRQHRVDQVLGDVLEGAAHLDQVPVDVLDHLRVHVALEAEVLVDVHEAVDVVGLELGSVEAGVGLRRQGVEQFLGLRAVGKNPV